MKRTFAVSVAMAILLLLTAMVLLPQAAYGRHDEVEDGTSRELIITIPVADRVDIDFVLVPAGSFIMGSADLEKDRDSDEGPLHEVNISTDFYMGKFEVTQEQWEAVIGANPSKYTDLPDNPVERVSWDDAQRFVAKLNSMDIGVFRLPTEAEWEYACRAGSSTRFPWGDDPDYALLAEYAWFGGESDEGPHTVGQKKPNVWGLYDMHGNVWEWCSDFYADKYPAGKQLDPTGPKSGTVRVRRGGCWFSDPRNLRSAERDSFSTTSLSCSFGFRLVMEVPIK